MNPGVVMGYRPGSQVITFPQITCPVRKRGRCPVCHRSVQRAWTFSNTVSPFNKNPETGLPRTEAEIRDHLREQARAWVPDFTHEKCRA